MRTAGLWPHAKRPKQSDLLVFFKANGGTRDGFSIVAHNAKGDSVAISSAVRVATLFSTF